MKHKYSVENVLFVALILIGVTVVDITWKYVLEKNIRNQAQYNLDQVKLCVNDIVAKNYNYKQNTFFGSFTANTKTCNTAKNINNEFLNKVLRTCALKMQLSDSSTVLAFDLQTEYIIFDASCVHVPYQKPHKNIFDLCITLPEI